MLRSVERLGFERDDEPGRTEKIVVRGSVGHSHYERYSFSPVHLELFVDAKS